jgi:hypothetical protein
LFKQDHHVAEHRIAGVVQGPVQLAHHLTTGTILRQHLILRLTICNCLFRTGSILAMVRKEGWLAGQE